MQSFYVVVTFVSFRVVCNVLCCFFRVINDVYDDDYNDDDYNDDDNDDDGG